MAKRANAGSVIHQCCSEWVLRLESRWGRYGSQVNVITLGKRWIPGRFYPGHMVYFYIKLSRLGARISLLLLCRARHSGNGFKAVIVITPSQ